MSSSSLPSSPTEPTWEMMAPVKQPAAVTVTEGRGLARPKLSAASSTPLALSKPTKRNKPSIPARAITDVSKVSKTISEEELLRREADAKARRLVEAEEAAAVSEVTAVTVPVAISKLQEAGDKLQPEPSPKTDSAPLGKLATRMKSLLRRNTSEKKKEKKVKPLQEFDRLEDAHWTEM